MAIDISAFAPSDIACLIERVFPGIAEHDAMSTARFTIPSSYMPQVVAIIEAVARIPAELLPIESSARLDLFAIVTAIRTIIASWMIGRAEGVSLEYLPGLSDRHPMDALRRALRSCQGNAAVQPCRVEQLIRARNLPQQAP